MRRIICCFLLTCLFSLSGCGIRDYVKQKKNLEEYEVKISDDIICFNGDIQYKVLDEMVEDNELGDWIGYVDKLVGDVYITSINKDKDNESIDVMINGKYYKAKQDMALEESDVLLSCEKLKAENNNSEKKEFCIVPGEEIVVNPDNGDQLIIGEEVYQITEKIVDESEMDQFLTVIAQQVVIDADTKEIIPPKELRKISVFGGDNNQKRELREYNTIYSIKGEKDSVAVDINNVKRIAERLQ